MDPKPSGKPGMDGKSSDWTPTWLKSCLVNTLLQLNWPSPIEISIRSEEVVKLCFFLTNSESPHLIASHWWSFLLKLGMKIIAPCSSRPAHILNKKDVSLVLQLQKRNTASLMSLASYLKSWQESRWGCMWDHVLLSQTADVTAK